MPRLEPVMTATWPVRSNGLLMGWCSSDGSLRSSGYLTANKPTGQSPEEPCCSTDDAEQGKQKTVNRQPFPDQPFPDMSRHPPGVRSNEIKRRGTDGQE